MWKARASKDAGKHRGQKWEINCWVFLFVYFSQFWYNILMDEAKLDINISSLENRTKFPYVAIVRTWNRLKAGVSVGHCPLLTVILCTNRFYILFILLCFSLFITQTLLQVFQALFLSFDNRAHSSQSSTFQLLAAVQRITVLHQAHVVFSNTAETMK